MFQRDRKKKAMHAFKLYILMLVILYGLGYIQIFKVIFKYIHLIIIFHVYTDKQAYIHKMEQYI